jgi:hydroxymethylglutaryl-CoA reductase
MFEEDIKKLLSYFTQISEGKQVNLNEMVKEFLVFFEKLKQELRIADEAQKREIFALMNDMHKKLLAETKKISEKTGMTDDQLLKFIENPSNFSPDQWQTIQEAKTKMKHASEELTQSLKVQSSREKPVKTRAKPRKPGTGRSGWVRS